MRNIRKYTLFIILTVFAFLAVEEVNVKHVNAMSASSQLETELIINTFGSSGLYNNKVTLNRPTINNYPDTLTLDVKYGFNGISRYGEDIPVTISIKNEGEYIEGSLCMTLPYLEQSIRDYYSFSINLLPSIVTGNNTYRYEYPISLNTGEQETITFYTYWGLSLPVMSVSVIENEEMVYLKYIQNEEELYSYYYSFCLYIGIMEPSGKLATLTNNSSIGYDSILTIKSIEYSQEDFPKERGMISGLNMFIVESSSLDALSKQQQQVLKEWIRGGGDLVILEDENNQNECVFLKAYIAEGSAENQTLRYSTRENEIPYSVYYDGGGKISYIEGTLNDVLKLNDEYSENYAAISMISHMIGEEQLESLTTSYMGKDYESWYLSALNNVFTDNAPNIFMYVGIFLLYMIIIGPPSYFLFKKWKKRELVWIHVGIISVIFTIIMLLAGSSTRLNAPVINYITVQTIENKTEREDTYFSIASPYNGDYELYVDPVYQVVPAFQSSGTQEVTGVDYFDYNVNIDFKEEETAFTFQNIPSFAAQYFHLVKTEESQAVSVKEEQAVTLIEEKAYGTIINSYDQDIQNAFVMLNDYIIPIGDLKRGESVELADFETIAIYEHYRSDAIEKIWNINEEQKKDNDNDYYTRLQVHNAVNTAMLESFSTFTDHAYLTGIVSVLNSAEFQMDSGYDSYGTTVVRIGLETNLRLENIEYFPYIYRSAKTEDGYDADYTYLSESESILEYDIETDLNNYEGELELRFLYDDYMENQWTKYFSGTIYFQNRKTLEYEEVNTLEHVFNNEELEDYISEGLLKVKYVDDNYRLNTASNTLLPKLKLTRRN